MASMINRAKHFLICHFISMYYFQEYIDQFRVYYDRSRFRRVDEDAQSGFSLLQYRALHPDDAFTVNYPLTISKSTVHLRFPIAFFALYLLRCLAILRVSYFTDSRLKRIWIGAEMFGRDDFYFESSFIFWTMLVFSFYQLALTDRLLDYKFLALLRMGSNQGSKSLKASDFGLDDKSYRAFASFRSKCYILYVSAVGSLHSGCPLAAASLLFHISLYSSHLLASIIWTILVSIWCFYVTTVLYSNYITLIVVAKYLYIKQSSIIAEIEASLERLQANRALLAVSHSRKVNSLQATRARASSKRVWRQFLGVNTRYAHLQEELADYGRFWSRALSYFIPTYVLLISFVIYIVFLSKTTIYLKILYGLILFFHIVLLSAILKFCGDIVRLDGRLRVRFQSALARFPYSQLPLIQLLKMNTLGHCLLDTQVAFTLLNGYKLTHDTFRDVSTSPHTIFGTRESRIIGSIAVYFVLIIKN